MLQRADRRKTKTIKRLPTAPSSSHRWKTSFIAFVHQFPWIRHLPVPLPLPPGLTRQRQQLTSRGRTIVADEPHANAIAAQDSRQLVIDPARDSDAVKCTVYRLHSVKRPAVALLNEFGSGDRRAGDQRRKGGEAGVSLLGFGSGK